MNALQIARLANRNELSLVLRHQWYMRWGGGDPANMAMRKVADCAGSVLVVLGFIICLSTSTFSDIYLVLYGPILLIVGVSFAGEGTLILLCARLLRLTSSRTLAFRDFIRAYECAQFYLNGKHAVLARLDFDDLRRLARQELVLLAGEVLRIQNMPPEDQRQPHNMAELRKFTDRVSEAYNAFAVFGLVYGGYEAFYKEAERQMKEGTQAAPLGMRQPSPAA